MCIHYQGSFCVVRADSTHGSKRKMFSHYHFRILFASKQSKQGCVLLTLSGLILLTYASHLTGQHLVHSHAHPSQPSRWVRRGGWWAWQRPAAWGQSSREGGRSAHLAADPWVGDLGQEGIWMGPEHHLPPPPSLLWGLL